MAIIVLVFAFDPLQAKPKTEKNNNGKKPSITKPKNQPKVKENNKGKAEGHEKIKSKNINRKNIDHKKRIQVEKNIKQKEDKLNKPSIKRPYQQINHAERRKDKKILLDLEKALQRLERARWSHNPHDTRGQGNMGRPEMLNPYGHDKDSDRLELYGNRGRVLKNPEPVPEPEPPPELPPEPPDL